VVPDDRPRQTDSAGSSEKPRRKLYLKLNLEQRGSVLRILSETPGDICVVLHMADEKKTYQAPREYWVNEGFDAESLIALLGEGSVVLK